GSTAGSSPGATTVTIIDGMSGKRQEVTINQAPQTPQVPQINATVDKRLVETSRHGPIPKIGSDGARAADVYARSTKSVTSKDGTRIAIVVGGLGIGAAGTMEALGKLPGPITLGFAPYGSDLARWVSRARSEGQELL